MSEAQGKFPPRMQCDPFPDPNKEKGTYYEYVSLPEVESLIAEARAEGSRKYEQARAMMAAMGIAEISTHEDQESGDFVIRLSKQERVGSQGNKVYEVLEARAGKGE